MSTIKAIYFDLDNTLVDRNASIEQFAIRFVANYRSQLHNPNVEVVSSIVKVTDNGGYLAPESRYHKIYEAVGAELAGKLEWKSAPDRSELIAFWRTAFPESTVEMSGAKKLLQSLHNQGYFIGIISNGAQASREKTLAATSFYFLVNQLVSSEAFGKKKPSPEIFINTLKSQGFRAHECMYVGDHPINDAIGALNAGMWSVLLAGFHRVDRSPENICQIHDLAEVESLVASI